MSFYVMSWISESWLVNATGLQILVTHFVMSSIHLKQSLLAQSCLVPTFNSWNWRATLNLIYNKFNFHVLFCFCYWLLMVEWKSIQSAVSGLNRGLAASEDDLQKADAAAKELEGAGGPVDLTINLDKLQGRWKLIYSSAFSSRTLGGSRPGPPTGRLLPITLGQVS